MSGWTTIIHQLLVELWFNDFQNSTSLLAILKIIPGGDHAWPTWMSPTGHSSQQSMKTGWTPPADSWSQGVCWALPCWELGAGSVKLGCLAQTPASWGPSVMRSSALDSAKKKKGGGGVKPWSLPTKPHLWGSSSYPPPPTPTPSPYVNHRVNL